jgi:hypothetical protein
MVLWIREADCVSDRWMKAGGLVVFSHGMMPYDSEEVSVNLRLAVWADDCTPLVGQ